MPVKVFFIFLFWVLFLGFWVLVFGWERKKGGTTTTPPLSAECQFRRKSRTKPGGARVCGGEFSGFVWFLLHSMRSLVTLKLSDWVTPNNL